MSELFVCIFPHADDEFASQLVLQEWLLNDFIEGDKPGQYYLRKIGLKDKDFVSRIVPGNLILFRKGENIVGEGIAETGIKQLDDPPVDGKYYNEIFVSPESVHTYELPVRDIENWCRREKFSTNLTNSRIKTGRYYLIVGRRASFEEEFVDRFSVTEHQPIITARSQGDDGDWTTGENIAKGFPRNVNSIPGEPTDQCYPILMVAIGSLDSIEARILEAAYHVKVSCPGKNKKVIFEVAKWDSETWRKHAEKFNNLELILRIKGSHGETAL